MLCRRRKKKNGRNLKHDTFLMHSLVAPHYNSCRHLLWGLYGVLCEIIILIIGIGMCVLSLTFAFTRLALLALLLKCVVLLFCGNFLFAFCATFFWNVIIGLHHNYKRFYLSLPRKTVNHWGHKGNWGGIECRVDSCNITQMPWYISS